MFLVLDNSVFVKYCNLFLRMVDYSMILFKYGCFLFDEVVVVLVFFGNLEYGIRSW